MSQSDYIRFKKTSTQLKNVAKLDAVLGAQDYTGFKQYALETAVSNTKPGLNQLTGDGNKIVFNMEMGISLCPITNFTVCNNTNLRANRALLLSTQSDASVINQNPEKRVVLIES
jgi:hypothetical protein